MNSVYSLIYDNTDEVKNSEVIGIFRDREVAIKALIKAAHYEERDGQLLQYKKPSNDFQSFDQLTQFVTENSYLEDYDLYRIEHVEFL